MGNNFTAVLDRVQRDYDFYVRVQSDPQSALAEYQLNPDERAALTNPNLLADALEQTLALRITVTIKGRHDWVNRAPKPKPPTPTRKQLIQHAVELVRAAKDEMNRRDSTLRLIQLFE
jgi:hypothetical protein